MLAEALDVGDLAERVVSSSGCVNWKLRASLEDYLLKQVLDDLPSAYALGRHHMLWELCMKRVLDKYLLRYPSENNAELEYFCYTAIGTLHTLMDGVTERYGQQAPAGVVQNGAMGVAPWMAKRRWPGSAKAEEVSSVLQFCLIHMGDMSRYVGFLGAAFYNYHKAFLLNPRQGHPLNQLGLIATKRQLHFPALYYYTRAYLSEESFQNASVNIRRYYASVDFGSTDKADFLSDFIRLQALLYTDGQEQLAQRVAVDVQASMTFDQMDSDQVLQMFVISLGTLAMVGSGVRQEIMLDFLRSFFARLVHHYAHGGGFERVVQPAYSLCRWIQYDRPEFLEHSKLHEDGRFLENLTLLLRNLQGDVYVSLKSSAFDTAVPAGVDRLLCGFTPLKESLGRLDFSTCLDRPADLTEAMLLQARLLQFGEFVASKVADKRMFRLTFFVTQPNITYCFDDAATGGGEAALVEKAEAEMGKKVADEVVTPQTMGDEPPKKQTEVNSCLKRALANKARPAPVKKYVRSQALQPSVGQRPVPPPPPDFDFDSLMSMFEKCATAEDSDEKPPTPSTKATAEQKVSFNGHDKAGSPSPTLLSDPSEGLKKRTTVGARLMRAFHGGSSLRASPSPSEGQLSTCSGGKTCKNFEVKT